MKTRRRPAIQVATATNVIGETLSLWLRQGLRILDACLCQTLPWFGAPSVWILRGARHSLCNPTPPACNACTKSNLCANVGRVNVDTNAEAAFAPDNLLTEIISRPHPHHLSFGASSVIESRLLGHL